MKKVYFFLTFFALIFLNIQLSASENYDFKDWAEIKIRDYLISNNVWGKKNIIAYQQGIAGELNKDIIKCGWKWKWPHNTGNVKGYPEIIYGWKPWNYSSTTYKLPIQIAQIKQVEVSYNITATGNGRYNTTFDVWITQSPYPRPQDISREIMIWLDAKEMRPKGYLLKKHITIAGEDYKLYFDKSDSNNSKWDCFSFVKTSPRLAGTININDFIIYLEQEKYITKNEYLASVEFGNEVISGQGRTEINNYSIKLE